ncbi:CHAT domain-containing protein [Streptomyces sp. RKAG293]|uniref:CHAT domain-containing protein n=1 Tax=Streptomyces sp. RKAG293 TaxID=2893403 RepID=UPI0020336A5D|nr:CHAT domain-containing protein [Streptomyces sp. RKAG293]MCM2422185.1 CHAT domain-containing protein [Streptomyces sp. RKAG293]
MVRAAGPVRRLRLALALRRARAASGGRRSPRRLGTVAALEAVLPGAGRADAVTLLEGIAALHAEAALRGEPGARACSVDALRRAVRAAGTGSAEEPVVLLELADALAELSEEAVDPGLLREAVTTARRGVEALGQDRLIRIMVLSAAARVLLAAGSDGGDPALLEEASGFVQDALAAGGGSLLHLAYGRRLHYEATGARESLDGAEVAAREAVAQCVRHDLEAADEHAELSQVLRHRFAATGDRKTASEAVETARRALAGYAGREEAHRHRCLLAGALTEYHGAGGAGALAEAVEQVRVAMAAAPHTSGVAQIAAAVLGTWAEEREDLDASREAEFAARIAVEASGGVQVRRAEALDTLADVLQTRWLLTEDPAALEDAVGLGEEAVALTPAALPSTRAGYLGNLGVARLHRYKATSNRADLDEAIRLTREALDLIDDDHPDAGRYLSNLGVALAERAEPAGSDDRLDEAIEVCRAAVRSSPPGPARIPRLSNLGSALYARYERFGDLADLDEDVDCQREAVRAAPLGHPDRPGLLSNLGTALTERNERLGSRDDLDEALTSLRAALDAIPPRGIRATVTNAYAMALHALHGATGDRVVLEQAITWLRSAVAATRPDDPELPWRLANLVTSLEVSSAHRAEAADEAVTVAREALRERREGSTANAIRANLALALAARRRDGDLDEAVDLARTVAARALEDDPGRAQALANLAYLLHQRHGTTGDPRDREGVRAALRSAALSTAAGPGVRLNAARSWGRIAAQDIGPGGPGEAAEALALAVELLPYATPRRLERPDAQRLLAEYAGLAGDAAALWLACGVPERALSLLELGRGVLLNRVLGIRGDTSEVRRADPGLARRFEELRDALDEMDARRVLRPSGSGDDVAAPVAPSAVGTDRERRRDLEAALDVLLRQIRRLPGLAGFQRPPEPTALLAEATDGPVVVVNVSSHRCDALVLTSGRLRHVPLPGLDAARLDDAASTIHRDAETALDPRTPKADADMAGERVAGVLDLLWHGAAAPVLAALEASGSFPRIWWVPTQALCHLPLHAATDRETGASVVDLTVSSYTPTVTALHHARTRTPDPEVREAAVIHSGSPDARTAPLPAVEREVALAARHLGVEPLDAARSDPAGVIGAITTCSHLHLALHSAADLDSPDDSGFLLAGIDLTVARIAAQRNGSGRLAYLSACETTRTVRHLADEAVHLTSAFQMAGFLSVVGTLWRVPDNVAEVAARFFYEELAASDGSHPALALTRVARRLRRRYAASPAAWAAHHHVGV